MVSFSLRRCSLVFLLMLAIDPVFADSYGPAPAGSETPAQHQARMKWWRDARFGMFYIYGPVTLTGQDISWSRANSNPTCPNKGPIPVDVYDNLYKRFNPSSFNADDWAGVAKDAGMKYVVLTAKHCDGFLLWNSKVDGYNIMAAPFHRDFCAELATAVRKAGLQMCWYFSPMDWRDPDCRSANNDRFVVKMQGEVRELLTNYGPIGVLWFDADGNRPDWHPETTYPLVRGLQPKIIIDNRLEMASIDEWNHQGKLRKNEDFYTPEQRIGGYDDTTPWETCMTLATQWAWKPNDPVKSASEVIGILARTVGGDGNLLLGVAPKSDGLIEPHQVEVLKQVGTWMKTNGESIYGTRGGPFKPGDFGASTRKDKNIYVHVLKWPEGPLMLPKIPAKIVSAALLKGGQTEAKQTEKGVEISVAPADRDASDTVVVLSLDTDAQLIPAVAVLPAATASR
jgi:alpha-L-fucosidase